MEKQIISKRKLTEIINSAFQSSELTANYSVEGVQLRPERDITGSNWHVLTDLSYIFDDTAMSTLIRLKNSFELEESP